MNRAHFNPLSPHGERHLDRANDVYWVLFQSTLPAWGETWATTSRTGSRKGFQSTLPAWGETVDKAVRASDELISIHSPRMGRDCIATQ